MSEQPLSNVCIGAEQIDALLAGKLPPDEVGKVLSHAVACPDCVALLQKSGYWPPGNNAAEDRGGAQTIDSSVSARPSRTPAAGVASATAETLALGNNPVYPFLDPPLAPGDLGRLDHYRVLRVLGEGGMGLVFEAKDTLLDRRVAIKSMRPAEFDESSKKRFLQEARLAASLPHERIVTIFQVGENRESPYIVMELLDGESLDFRLKREGSLPLGEALRIAREVAEGLAVAHERGLVHRDIKPPNVFLEKGAGAEAGGRVKLLDFGVARAVQSREQMTMQGQIVGTPGYMSPEQVCGMAVDTRSDLFSLGCLLYAMLHGESPFRRTTDMATLQAVVTEPAPSIEEKLPHLPTRIARFISRLLEKVADERPRGAEAVVEELRNFERQLAAAGSPTTAFGRNKRARKKWSRRKKLGWSGAAGAATIVIAAIIGAWAGWNDHREGLLAGAGNREPQAASSDGAKPGSSPTPLAPSRQPIKIGVVLSLTGVMAPSEGPMLDAIEFAVKEINDQGGLLGGRPVQVCVEDCHSKQEEFATRAEKLINESGVVTLFGCWRSPARKLVEPVCAKYDNLLVFPLAYEGLEESPYVIYMGGAPNQQLLPAVQFACSQLKRFKFFLVGAEGIYSYAAHAILSDEILKLRGQVVGDVHVPVGSPHFTEIAEKIKAAQADVILSTVSGTGNSAFFHCLWDAKILPAEVPTISFRVTEGDLRSLSGDHVVGQYAAWSYFRSLDRPENTDFVEKFLKSYPGQGVTISDPMEASYVGVRLWAKAVAEAKSDATPAIRAAFVKQKIAAPEGKLEIDPDNRHAYRTARIGQVTEDFGFQIVYNTPGPLRPEPFPSSRTKAEWREFLKTVPPLEQSSDAPQPAPAP